MMAANSRTATSRCAPGDYADCKDADIVVITVGRKPPANSNRMAELGFTVGLVGEVVDNVMASGFDGVIVMVSNPVDVMAWYAWKRSGLPRTQVLVPAPRSTPRVSRPSSAKRPASTRATWAAS